MRVTKIVSTKIGEQNRVFTKLVCKGPNDVQEIETMNPAGIHSRGLKDDVAVMSDTEVMGESVLVGYIPKDVDVEEGEIRIFSRDPGNGAQKIFIWVKNDGVIEFGGNADNLIRYTKTANSINELKDSINDLKNIISAWVPVPNDGGAALKSALASWFASPLVQDISGAKIDELKTL